MKDLHCRDAGMKCDYVARGSSDEDVLKQAGTHAQSVHGMSVTPELEKQMRGLIHDESSEAHRRSMSQAGKSP
jgi:predicted small metal-binding protein